MSFKWIYGICLASVPAIAHARGGDLMPVIVIAALIIFLPIIKILFSWYLFACFTLIPIGMGLYYIFAKNSMSGIILVIIGGGFLYACTFADIRDWFNKKK